MRYGRFYVGKSADGSRPVLVTGPLGEVARVLYPFFVVALVICLYQAVYDQHFKSAGVFFLLFALFIPGTRRLRKHGASDKVVRGYLVVVLVILLAVLPVALIGAIAH